MKVAVAQTNSILGDLDKNIEHHLEFCNKAVAEGADLVVFPELSLTGYTLKDINYEICVNPYTSDKLDALKEKSNEISIVCGFVEEDDNYAVYNSAGYFENGELLFTHRKVYPPTYGIFEEMRYFTRGRDCRAHETKFCKMGVLVCEDLWHMSMPLTQMLDGAKIIIGIAASPTRLAADSGEELKNYEINSEHHKTYSRLLSLYTVFAGRVGYEDGVNFWGGSEIVDPFGNVIVKGKFFDEDIIYADISMDEVRRARRLARHAVDEDISLTVDNLINVMEK